MPLSVEYDRWVTPKERAAFDANLASLKRGSRHNALFQDIDAKMRVLPGATSTNIMGTYSPSKNTVSIPAMDPDPVAQQNTIVHELTHALQFMPKADARAKFANNPLQRFPGRDFIGKNDPVPGDAGTPYDFSNKLADSGIMYGQEEPAAFLSSELLGGRMPDTNGVRQVLNDFPTQAVRFAQRNAQPNRAMPVHYKGYPEMTTMERLASMFGSGPPPALEESQMDAGARSYVDVLRANLPALKRR